MKKAIVLLAVIILILTLIKNVNEETIVIPKDSIRIRVIANSNNLNDQYEKNKVKESVQKYLEILLKNVSSKQETEKILKQNLSNINKEVEKTLSEIGNKTMYKINYGNNFFPKKEYKGVTYESGFYESLIITLGEGKGNNWWCVLFPPLCLIDENEELSNNEYKLYITELIEKYN